jgi:immune inhibitor A
MQRGHIHCIMPAAPALERKIVLSRQRLVAGEALPAAPTSDLLDMPTLGLIMSRPAKSREYSAFKKAEEGAPATGTKNVLVLLVDFSDNVAATPQSHFNHLLFSSGSYATGSMRDFYWEASYKKLVIAGQVSGTGGATVGWYRAPHPYSYYTNGNFGWGAYPNNCQRLVEELVDMAAPHVNFPDYDNDGDGLVDALMIVHAGPGAETTGNSNQVWSHAWGITAKTVQGVKVSGYCIQPEDGAIGVFCHEFGHVLGLPDLYDTDYTSAGDGNWDLMASGSWNNGGRTPAHPTAYCKVKLGWVAPKTLFNQFEHAVLQPYANSDQVYKLPIGTLTSKEYFLASNRNQTGFDTCVPGGGLIIEHVDENKTGNTDETHYLVDIEEADGKNDLNKNANRGDATDPFPTASNNAFTDSSNPNARSYAGAASSVAVTNIVRSGVNIEADISVGGAAAKGWYYDRTVDATFAHYTSQWAWAAIQGIGWRRLKDGAPDGVTNMFAALCDARATGRNVHVYADGSLIYTMFMV